LGEACVKDVVDVSAVKKKKNQWKASLNMSTAFTSKGDGGVDCFPPPGLVRRSQTKRKHQPNILHYRKNGCRQQGEANQKYSNV